MTVAELIAKLQQCEPSALVLVLDIDTGNDIELQSVESPAENIERHYCDPPITGPAVRLSCETPVRETEDE